MRRYLWVAIPISILALGAAFFAVVSSDPNAAGKRFCNEVYGALACHDDKDRCLIDYHRSVTVRLAEAKTSKSDFWYNSVLLDDMDSIYAEGKELLSSNLFETAPKDYETQRAALLDGCLGSLPSN